MRLRSYPSYDDYKEIQSQFSVRKRRKVWAQKHILDEVASQIRSLKIQSPFGICHGVRNGFEVSYLQKHLSDIDVNVIGTEISEVSEENSLTIQWDFHDVKPEWIGKVDFIYSNSFDHSYKPQECMNSWMSCISPNGICILEWSDLHDAAGTGEADCFRASLDEYKSLANQFHVEDIAMDGKHIPHLVLISRPK